MATYIDAPMRIVSFTSVTLHDADVTSVLKVFNKFGTMANSLKRDRNVASAWAWMYAATGSEPKIMRRSDFIKIMQLPKPPRQQIACLLGMKQGFRSGEVPIFKAEWVKLDEGVLYVYDTKDLKFYPLPLDRETGYCFDKAELDDGYVLRHHDRFKVFKDKPLSRVTWINMVKRWAKEVGALDWQSFHPTLLRVFFAKEWARRGGDIVLLSKMMRHEEPVTTWFYLQKFVYLEDLRNEMERLYQPPEPLREMKDVEQ